MRLFAPCVDGTPAVHLRSFVFGALLVLLFQSFREGMSVEKTLGRSMELDAVLRQNNHTSTVLQPVQNNHTSSVVQHKNSQETHWCVLSHAVLPFRSPHWFDHFPHCSEVLLPCWSLFRQHNATDSCGFVLLDELRFDKYGNNTWQAQLVQHMGCQVKYTFPKKTAENVLHAPNMRRIRPRYMHRVYLQHPEDAHALRRKVISDELLERRLASQGTQLQIGLLQRETHRRIVNLDDVHQVLQKALPDANITQTTLPYSSIEDQALWFATKDVIITPHGAAVANAVFIRPETIVLQVYPSGFFFNSMEPLVEQAGGIALDCYDGNEPIKDHLEGKAKGESHLRQHANITVKVNQIANIVVTALGTHGVGTRYNTKFLW